MTQAILKADALDVPTRRRHNKTLALRLAAAGIPIFPSSGKVPLIPRWQHLNSNIGADDRAAAVSEFQGKRGRAPTHLGATIDTATVKKLWREFPDAVPSISCGPSGLIALDADQHKNGPALLAQWEAQNGGRHALAPVTKTQSGGEHVWFRNDPHAPLGNAAGAFADTGTDVRGAGGQCVAPGSIREDGARYISADGAPDLIEAFKSGSIPMLPAPVAKVLREGASRASNVTSLDEARVAKEIEKLRASDWLDFDDISDPSIGYDLNTLLANDATFAELWHNPSGDHSEDRFALARCLRRAYGSKFSVVDYASIITGFDGAGTLDDTSRGKGLYNVRDLAREFVKAGSAVRSDASQFGAVIDDEDDDDVPPPNGASAKRSKFRVESFDDAARTALDDAEKPLVAGLLDEGSMSVLYGASNAGKTFVALDLAFHVAAGRAWDGRRVSQGLVIYLAAEGGQRIKRRVAALRKHYCGEDSANVLFALVRSPIDLCSNAADAAEISRLVKTQEAAFGMKAALIVIDTLSRAMAGRDENSSVDMGALVANSDRIRSNTSAHLMLIHHAGKDAVRGARGHSLLRAATDTELEVIGAKGRGKIEVKKQRDLDFAPDRTFRLVDVPLGRDADGAEIKSAVMVLDGATAATTGEGLACNDEAADLGEGPDEGRIPDEPAPLREREGRILELVQAAGEPMTQTAVLEAYNRKWGRVDGTLGKDAVKNSLEKLRGAYLDQTQETNRALRRWFAVEAHDTDEGSE